LLILDDFDFLKILSILVGLWCYLLVILTYIFPIAPMLSTFPILIGHPCNFLWSIYSIWFPIENIFEAI
jgi:hypothetical protein